MRLNEEYTLKVEKLINEGSGLARIDNFPIFIDDAVPNDILKVKITSIKKNFANAKIMEIVSPSPYRIKPLCPLFKVCGSCNWLNIEYKEQLRQKAVIVSETIKNITGKKFNINPTIPSPKTIHYRCKIQYPVMQKKSGRIIAGYYIKSSHNLVNIKYCPMHSPIISKILEFIKEKAQELKISGYNEKNHSGCLRHVIFRQSAFDEKLLIILVINRKYIDKKITELAENLMFKYPEISGVCANFNTIKSNVILAQETKSVLGNDFYVEKLSDITFKISANSFFQVNPYSAEIIFNTVKGIISSRLIKPSVLDAYSGVSSFGIWLSSVAKEVVSVEEITSATDDAFENAKINNIKNIEIINGDASKIFDKFIKTNKKFDVVLIDPPRKGSSVYALKNILSLADKYIIYVSCNPATLARDLSFLIENNFVPELIQPVDMFPNTAHIETVVLIKNCNKKEA